MAKTLGEQLDEIETSLSAARSAMSYKDGGREVHRSYIQLRTEKEEILKKIERHGRDFIEGQNTEPTRKGPRMRKAVFKG